MSLLSIFSKKQPEATSVAEALSGTMNLSSAKPKKRTESRHPDEHLMSERKRARRRLIGAVVMVLAVIIGLPMILDPEPKQSGKNILIQIPSKDLSPITLDSKEDRAEAEQLPPVPVQLSKSTVQEPIAPSSPSASSSTPSRERAADQKILTQSVKSSEKTDTNKDINNAGVKSATGLLAKKETPVKKKEAGSKNGGESARALAILDGANSFGGENTKQAKKENSKENQRIVVQIGAFATQEKVDELRDKLTSAGIKSYIQKVGTNTGDKIRVRIGPFSDKESADKARKQLEKLGLNGSLITL